MSEKVDEGSVVDVSEAFDLFLAGETGKVIVEADPS